METTYVVGIIQDNLLGPIARPFIIHKPINKGFYPIEAQVSEFNISKYEADLPVAQKKIFEISQEYSENSLYKIFKSKKDKNTKQFLNNLKKEDVTKKIRPYIEKRLVKITDILRNSSIEVYYKDKHKFINKDNQVIVLNEPATTVFNIIKDQQETRYYLSINHDGKEINLLEKPYDILTHDPCRIIIEDQLYSFEDVDAKKLTPFFNKSFIIVPKEFEKKWFETFALPNIKKYKVKPVGFKIEKANPEKHAVVSLENDLNLKPALLCRFQYGVHTFYSDHDQQGRVDLVTDEDTYKFIKIERDHQWEKEIIRLLEDYGLHNYQGSYFRPEHIINDTLSEEEILFTTIEWLKEHKEKLENYHIRIEQNLKERHYSLSQFHIKAETAEYNDWFDIRGVVEINGFQFPFSKLKKYILQGIREIKLPDGTYGVLPEEWFEKYADLFKFGKVKDDSLLVSKHHFKLLEENLSSIDNTYLQRLKELSDNLESQQTEPPSKLASILRPYQKSGFQWMYLLRDQHFGGCLADDMGLGKTLQTLTLLTRVKEEVASMEVEVVRKKASNQLNLFEQEESVHQKMEVKPTFLIVMPTSLIHNWQNEIKKFTPEFSIYNYTGLTRTSHPLELYKYDIVLTTYGIVRNDFELLKNIYFYYIILDESQYIKNPSSKVYKAITELKSEHKLVLTGTPIENSLSDLWAQLSFLNPGLLGSYNFFRNEFIHPIEKFRDENKEEKLRNLISPFILRRTKHQVAKDLPEKMEQVIYCDMTEDQNSYYESEKSKVRNSIIEQIENTGEKSSLHILEGLNKLRQMANHPVMTDNSYTGDSGKFTEIKDYLESLLSEGHKVLVFSSYKKHLRLVKNYLENAGHRYSLLTGETYDRQKEVDAFQNNPDNSVFLIQIKAGGFGLNLTAADYVMILDPWWNPAVEEQAINRAHRIGQDKKVMVYRFISVDTVEEKIQKLQDRKAKLADTFVTQETIRHLSKEQIMELFQ